MIYLGIVQDLYRKIPNPGNKCFVDHADYICTAPTRQHELETTDHDLDHEVGDR